MDSLDNTNEKLYFLIKDIDECNILSINFDNNEVSYNLEINLDYNIIISINNIKQFIDNLQINDYVFQSFNDSNNSSTNICYNKGQLIFSTSQYNGEIWSENNFKVKYDKNKIIDLFNEIYKNIIILPH
jgi:hypothetical protein